MNTFQLCLVVVMLLFNFKQSTTEESDVKDTAEEFDPLTEMKKLWQQEILEGEEFKQKLRDEGVNVEKWEERFASAGKEVKTLENEEKVKHQHEEM